MRKPQARRVRLADHKVEMIISLRDLHRATGSGGNTQISVAPDGSAVFTRDIGTQDIYALAVKWLLVVKRRGLPEGRSLILGV